MILRIFIDINYKKIFYFLGFLLFSVQAVLPNRISDWINGYAKQVYDSAREPFYGGKTRIELKNPKEVYEYFNKSSYVSAMLGVGLLSVTLYMVYNFKKLFSLHTQVKEKRKLNQETTWEENRYFEDMVKTALVIPYGIIGSSALLIQAVIAAKVKQLAGQDLQK